ncbi:MAG: GDP-mannose 4,6-dehydratase [Sulfuricurvum sp.]|jgi:nucleoside-diphosphate-sugar epimerase|uniref:GDP-mannose 4,6-dehydratase n=1 Tax=Sulfuricurvum sp. TaxID=2025608 RepID=UPI0025ED62DF|nr:GDP-mannose 4,6-dehydratase [Sulfuricurvum sp.]MCK9372283.1 GDP-mannose 4,6-dehydratase [Sulfuricurvum sp.]
MTVFITGIDGFTGKHLEIFLRNLGYAVYGSVQDKSKNPNHLQCDIRNRDDVKRVITKVKPDYLFHLAAISFVGESDKSMMYSVNVLGTQNILEGCLEVSTLKKIVIASSATVYGNQGSSVLDESMCPKPVEHYGISKLAMECMARTYFDRLNILIVRPFNYTGVGHSNNFVIPKIVTHFREKKEGIELGNLDVSREFNDVRVVVEWYEKLMRCSAKSDVVNVCTGSGVKLLTVIELLEELSEYSIDIQVNPMFMRKNEIPVLTGSAMKLGSFIELDNKYTIRDTLQWMYSSAAKE